MSADNQMVVVKCRDKWQVYMQLGDNPYDEWQRKHGPWFKEFKNKLDAGFHQIKWDGTNRFNTSVASGVYFYRLVAKGFGTKKTFVNTKKMLFLK